MAETTPDRLVAALTAAGWVQDGGEHAIAKFWWMAEEPPRLLVVPLDPSVPDYDGMIATVLADLQRLVDLGDAADQALTLATCSCGGKRWVDNEGWSPPDWAMAVKPVREPGDGLIPCGNCNFGGWKLPVGSPS